MSDEKNKYGVDTEGIRAAIKPWRQWWLAEFLKIREPHFSNMITGERKFPRNKVGKLAGKIGISTDVIIRLFALDDKKI